MPTNTTMNFEEFHKQLADAPVSFRRKLRDYLRNPTERNVCYIAGCIGALEDARLFKTDAAASYWLAFVFSAEGNDTLGRELIAEMDKPPAEYSKEPSIEELEHENRLLRARNDRLERAALQDEALLREALEALERGAWDTLRGRNAAAAIRARLGEGEQQ